MSTENYYILLVSWTDYLNPLKKYSALSQKLRLNSVHSAKTIEAMQNKAKNLKFTLLNNNNISGFSNHISVTGSNTIIAADIGKLHSIDLQSNTATQVDLKHRYQISMNVYNYAA